MLGAGYLNPSLSKYFKTILSTPSWVNHITFMLLAKVVCALFIAAVFLDFKVLQLSRPNSNADYFWAAGSPLIVIPAICIAFWVDAVPYEIGWFPKPLNSFGNFFYSFKTSRGFTAFHGFSCHHPDNIRIRFECRSLGGYNL